jgi:hypothetical protein
MFADNCNYVSRFDEVLSLKASKHSLLESQKDIEEKLYRQVAAQNQQIEAL